MGNCKNKNHMITSLNDIIIRNAQLTDLEQLLSLIGQLGYQQSLDTFEKQFKLFTSQNDYGVVIAQREKQVVGFIAWSKSILLVSSAVRIRIESLVIDQQYRGKNVGKALMLYLEEAAKKFSPCIIELTSGVRRAAEGTHQFYKALGYHNEGNMAKLYLRKTI